MKVAVSSQGKTVESAVDPRFGRARYFVVVDTETGEYSYHDNKQNLNAAQGAGIQTARNVIELGVEAVVSGNLGPKAFTTLQAGQVAMYVGAQGSVKEIITQLRNGQLKPVTKPNVDGHWM
ncbi:MAG: dinitrogenase iron-molybdenum cofactor biosynthesis protein [Candidatus Omnitrophota bacterium]|nr:MAG: dinitrogenase iron-molybdenum cofactor biosynthesis protein [Candidatus Omnitrophota bacterium]